MSAQINDTMITGVVHAQQALAAYANFNTTGTPNTIKLTEAGMSLAQAQEFAENWTVVNQFNSTLTGVSATVFENVLTGEKTLSIRGTEVSDLRDIFGDTLIAIGVPAALNIQYMALKSQVKDWIADGTLPQEFTVDGHSAGGYYGVALKQDSDFQNNITQAYVFNTPGDTGLLGSVVSLFGASTTPDPEITIFTTAGGFSPIAGLGLPAGATIISVNTANDWSHSQVNLLNGVVNASENVAGSGANMRVCTAADTFMTTAMSATTDADWNNKVYDEAGKISYEESVKGDGSYIDSYYANGVVSWQEGIDKNNVEFIKQYADGIIISENRTMFTINNDVASTLTINYSDGMPVERITYDAGGAMKSHAEITYDDYNIKISETISYYDANNRVSSEIVRDGSNVIASKTTFTYNADNSVTVTTKGLNIDGSLNNATRTTTNADNSKIITVDSDGDGRPDTVTNINSVGVTTSDTSIEYRFDGSLREYTKEYDSDGSLKAYTYEDKPSLITVGLNRTADFLSLISAIKSGQPLPIISSGLNVTNDLAAIGENKELAQQLVGTIAIAGAAGSIMSLDQYIKNGDAMGISYSGAQLVSYTADIFYEYASDEIANIAANVSDVVSDILPGLGIATSLVHGDYTGAAVAAISLIPGMQWVGAGYAVYTLVAGLLTDTPEAWGSGSFTWNADGSIGLDVVGETGGGDRVSQQLGNVKQYLEYLVQQERAANPAMPFSLIPGRMPSLSYGDGQFTLHDLDSVTGELRDRRYTYDGRRNDVAVDNPEYFQDLREAAIYNAIDRQAFAPAYEADTVRQKLDAGDPKALLTEVQIASQENMLAHAATGDSQRFRPIALDLNGNGQITQLSRNDSGVAFDVDDSGFLKQTGWLGGDDGFLVLDRNFNSSIDAGSELFSNSRVADEIKGVPGLRYWDANYDGRLTAADPVFQYLQVWQDGNQNGVVDANESHTLAESGVTELNYSMNTFAQNGHDKLMASADLTADTSGMRVSVVEEGLLVESSNHEVSIICTTVRDLSTKRPNADRFTTSEDRVKLISPESLLDNDNLLNGTRIVGVGEARYGSVLMLDSGMIEFTPEANYNGNEAGFSYTVQLASGPQSSAPVAVVVSSVNDLPTATVLADATPAGSFDPNTGHITVSDVDTPVGPFTFAIAATPQYGNAYIDAAGQYRYESLTGTEGALTVYNHIDAGDLATADSFVIRVKDQDGGETTKTVSVSHYGALPAPAIVTQPDLAPVADQIAIDEDQVKLITPDSLLANDNMPADAQIVSVGGARHGLVRILESGEIAFAPEADYNGNEAVFSYTVQLANGAQGSAPVSVLVSSVNDLPTATVQADATPTGSFDPNAGYINVSDVDTPAGPFTFAIADKPQYGNAYITAAGQYRYESLTGTEGSLTVYNPTSANDPFVDDSFVVRVKDPDGGETTKTVRVTHYGAIPVTAEIFVPTLGADGEGTLEDAPLFIDPVYLLRNDKLPAGSRIVSVGEIRNGKEVQILDNGQIKFLPDTNYNGNEAGFNYTVQLPDGVLLTAPVIVSVTPVNDVPMAEAIDNPDVPVYGWEYKINETNSDGLTLPYTYRSSSLLPKDAYSIVTFYSPWLETVQTDKVIGYFGGDGIPIFETVEVLRDTVVASAVSNTGHIDVKDEDNPTGPFTYEIGAKPKYGYAYIDGDGKYRYESVTGPEESLTVHQPNGGVYETNTADPFQVKITDPDGGETIQTINVTHYGDLPYASGGGKKPIAIDLNNDGLSFTKVDDSNVFYDFNNDGWREQVSWLKNGDGFLAFDSDGNGKIETAMELSFVTYSPGAQTDLEGLRGFDNNGDGLLTRLDERWSKLGVWVDANQNGITDSGEFQTLDARGIVSIGLQSDGKFQQIDGNTIHGTTAVTFADGHMATAADVTVATSSRIIMHNPDGTSTIETMSPFAPSGQTFEGTPDDDLMIGTNGNTILRGYAGDDFIYDDVGNDWIEGGDGNDVIYSGADSDLVDGGAGNDIIYSGLGNDMVFGNTGNDMIYAEAGNDVVFAGEGNDFVAAGSGNDMVDGREGNDTIYGEQGNDALLGGTGNDSLYGGAGNDLLYGQEGDDLLDGGEGADTMDGGTGDDIYYVDQAADLVIETENAGTDLVRSSVSYTLGANMENLALLGSDNLEATGNDRDNVLLGNAGNNLLDGGVGNDVLDGGAGSDVMYGGTGDDTYLVDNIGDLVVEQAGEGTDVVLSGADYTLTANVENLILTGAAMVGTGNELDNRIVANGNGDVLSGLSGNDTLIGGGGSDTLVGGDGADVMRGGAGDDTYIVDNAGDQVTERAGEGTDTVVSSIDYTLGANVENLTLTGVAVAGTGNELNNILVANVNGDALYGMAGNDTLIGGVGNDTLDGGIGVDLMQGGRGDDTYLVENAGDLVIELAGEGTDTVISNIDYALTANVENLSLAGGAIVGNGNELDNRIVANDNGDTLFSLAGNDTLIGGVGSDLLDGGTGADVISGGTGDDTYVVDNQGDQVIELVGEGIDHVFSSVDYTLTTNVENLTLTGAAVVGVGNELVNYIVANDSGDTLSGLPGNDTLIGGIGIDILDGGIGADLLQGGMGDDTFFVDNSGDLAVEQGGEGIDSVFSSIDYTLTANVENLTLTGGAIQATGNELDNVLVANDSGDRLSGLSGNDTLIGGTGNDILDGGIGADLMSGGTGNDIYIVDKTGDQVVEQAGEGADTVQSSIDYFLTANVENLTLAGGAMQGTGNELDNILVANGNGNTLYGLAGNDTLTGGAGSDVLDGGIGADLMQGGMGDDSYIVDNAGDLVVEQSVAGTDTVWAGIDYILTANVENLILTGTASVGSGNELDNRIVTNDNGNNISGLEGDDLLIGGMGNDVLDGGIGADLMQGGRGDDTYLVENAGDLVIELAGEGTDTVISNIDYALTANVENLSLAGGAIVGNGNELDNRIVANDNGDTLFSLAGNDTLIGGVGSDLLDGGTGADVISGGTGDDTYVVDNQGDQVIELVGEGVDHVLSSVDYTLTADIENLALTGTAMIGTGNESDNRLVANDNGNILYGLSGNDTLVGGIGNDTLDGGIGADLLQGGIGDDIYVVGNQGDQVIELVGEDIDHVFSSVDYTLTTNVENLTLTGAAVVGVGNELDNYIVANDSGDTLSGLSGNDTLIGGIGIDTLDGGIGADSMQGGRGDDTYVVDYVGDLAIELVAEGTDTVFSSIDYTLSANFESLTLSGAAIVGTGNELDNRIVANDNGDFLYGIAGSDTLIGGADNDYMDGGEGTDLMQGGKGGDVYFLDNVGDQIVEQVGEGMDVVFSSIDYTLTANVESLTLTGGAVSGAGNELDNNLVANNNGDFLFGLSGNDILIGGTGNDMLDGGIGSDMLYGGLGNETYIVDNLGDQVVEQAGEGTDTVLSGIDYTLTGNVENLTLTGGAVQGTGNELGNLIVANDYGDSLSSMSGNDTLIGGAGNDILDGGIGADLLQGGMGDDTFFVDNSGDLAVEQGCEGIDSVFSSIDYTLTANVENLTLTGGAIQATGNELDNVLVANDSGDRLSGLSGNDTLIGGTGNDTLDGSIGADLMSGGTGNDIYIVDKTGDQVVEQAGEGADTVQSSIDYILTANVENLTLTGGATQGTGNKLDNLIVANNNGDSLYGLAGNDALLGGTGNDMLDGGIGADLMNGGTGNDIYIFDNAGDIVDEKNGEGSDTVQSSIDYTLTANVENLTLAGGATQGTGNELDNILVANGNGNTLYGLAGNDTLTGGAGSDVLDGGIGADLMQGGMGDDSYIVDNAGDLVVEQSVAGTDTVWAGIDYILTANVENLILTGTASVGSGNELDNRIVTNDNGNNISGLEGNDLLIGGMGNDVLDGGSGADQMQGGMGNDIYVVDNSGDLVSELGTEGTDSVYSSIDYVLTDYVEDLTLTGAAVTGAGNDLGNLIVANDNGDSLFGMAGDDTLVGGVGNDLFYGGTGDDTYIVNNVADLVTEQASEGIDSVYSRVDYVLTSNVENMTLTGAAVFGQGNELDNLIIGNDNGNTLYGFSGNDTLIGGVGNDVLYAGTGNNIVDAGNGDNIIFVGRGNNVINSGNGNDWIVVGESDNNSSKWGWLTDKDDKQNNSGDDHGASAIDDYTEAGHGNSHYQFTGGDGQDVNFDKGGAKYILRLEDNNENGWIVVGKDNKESSEEEWLANRGNNIIDAGAGIDVILANKGNDVINGGNGNDAIGAGEGNNIVRGGKDDDYISTGHGDDLYLYARGDGQDLIYDKGGIDTLRLEGINSDQLWFHSSGHDLNISVVGAVDSITVKGWYENHTIERIEAADGKVILDSQVNALVNAMAAFMRV